MKSAKRFIAFALPLLLTLPALSAAGPEKPAAAATPDTQENFRGKIAKCRITFPLDTTPGEHITEISRLELRP